MHSHGRQKYVNDRDDLESLRPSRPPGSRLIVLSGPGPAGVGGIIGGMGIPGVATQRVSQLRDSLSQVGMRHAIVKIVKQLQMYTYRFLT